MTDINNIRLLVSIVNYRSADLVCAMLPDLIKQIDTTQDTVCIVDNDSGDESVEKLKKFVNLHGFSDFVEVIASEKNGGFSFGNNLAIKTVIDTYAVEPDYVLLLNPDTKVLDGSITTLVEYMKTNSRAGIVGSRLEAETGEPQCSAFRFQTLRTELVSSLRLGILDRLFPAWRVSSIGTPEQNTQVDWVAGASMLIRYDVIRDIGLMDESYFLYFEETDFCLQAYRKGWECWYVPESRVIHFVGQSTGVVSGDRLRRRRPKYWFESRQYYFKKNYGFFYTMAADLIWGLGFAAWRLRRLLQRKEDRDPVHMLRDFWRNSIFLSWVGK